MAWDDGIKRAATNLIFERPMRGQTPAQMADTLQREGDKLAARLSRVAQTDRAHALITHIIGIERWSLPRLRVGLGEAMPQGEYDPYRPAKDTPWAELVPLFLAARAESAALARQLPESALSLDVRHNQWGAMSLRAWVGYLVQHANIEARKLG